MQATYDVLTTTAALLQAAVIAILSDLVSHSMTNSNLVTFNAIVTQVLVFNALVTQALVFNTLVTQVLIFRKLDSFQPRLIFNNSPGAPFVHLSIPSLTLTTFTHTINTFVNMVMIHIKRLFMSLLGMLFPR